MPAPEQGAVYVFKASLKSKKISLFGEPKTR